MPEVNPDKSSASLWDTWKNRYNIIDSSMRIPDNKMLDAALNLNIIAVVVKLEGAYIYGFGEYVYNKLAAKGFTGSK